MTIERPMFPPRAESADSFSLTRPPGDRPDETPPSDFPGPAQAPAPSATILELRPRPINPVQKAEYEGLSPWKARNKREELSSIIKATTSYVCNQSTIASGYIADRTCDGVFAGYGGIVGEKHVKAADRSMRKLVKLMDQSTEVLTVELRSLACVADFVMKQMEDDEPIEEKEIAFLKSFARLVERLCKAQYERETQAVRS